MVNYHQKNSQLILSSLNIGRERAEIVKLTGIPRTTVYDTLKRMRLKKQVRSVKQLRNGQRGRPKTIWFSSDN